MTSPDYAAQAEAHAALLAAVALRATTAQADTEAAQLLGEAVRAAFAVGVKPSLIVKATGLSRTRIYEIRDARPATENEPNE